MDNAHEFLDGIHERGHRVIVHSCNSVAYIRQQCEKWNLRVDAIWGELPGQEGAKPVCAAYLDDRAIQFRGNLIDSLGEILAFVDNRPVRRY
jgi:hypothetical protein